MLADLKSLRQIFEEWPDFDLLSFVEDKLKFLFLDYCLDNGVANS